MTIKETASQLGDMIAELQDQCGATVKSMASAENLPALRDLQRQADQIRSAIEAMQRAYLILTPLAREIEINAEAATAARAAAAKQ